MSEQKIGYFDKIKKHETFIKILTGIILALIISLLLVVKSLISIASNKTIVVQVPQFMESGNYIIGNTFASESVYKMWGKVWVQDIANFSYQNIRQKYENIYPFLDQQTIYKSKAELLKFIDFVENNFVTQTFKIQDISTKKVPGGYVKIIIRGTVNRKIGGTKDRLNGMRYSYEFLTYVKNGQIYIKSIQTAFFALFDKQQRDKLKDNKFVNFDEVIQ